jgi:hypothetical protein
MLPQLPGHSRGTYHEKTLIVFPRVSESPSPERLARNRGKCSLNNCGRPTG